MFILPFQRDIDLNNKKIKVVQDLIHQCRSERGFLVLAPEHKLSLELKVKELSLNRNSDLSEELEKVVSGNSYCDIIDEVDEVLNHRFQLVYSVGTPQALPQGMSRWLSVQALLKVVKKLKLEGLKIIPNEVTPEAFPYIEIDENLNVPNFRKSITNLLLNDPPFCMSWTKQYSKTELLIDIITKPETDPMSINLPRENFHFVLSLRGLLAYDILLHSLRKRHRVDYGVNECGKKRLSVPFRGADTPAKRAEFSHPDCAITLTNLAYYEEGLGEDEIREVFELLLAKGKDAQQIIYSEWLDQSKVRMQSNVLESVDSVYKIDMTNCYTVDILFEHFRLNPSTIDFWLNSCVYPCEIDQYPKRLVGNSWHLAAHQGHCVGFSGTNDNHQIIPLQLKQYLPWETTDRIWQSLLSTNGRMLDVIMSSTKSCVELGEGLSHHMLLSFVKDVMNKKSKNRTIQKDWNIDAIIVCGALLAGHSNGNVAKFIMDNCLLHQNARLRGVTYFDEEENSWMILEASGRCVPKDQSPLMESETFALFDEPRCRGVDLKLRPDAMAVLTLGQDMCKDKLMQAAGRLRQLSRGQKLIMVGAPKIFKGIRETNHTGRSISKPITKRLKLHHDVTINHVTSWIMHNTVTSIWKGVGLWIDQGMFYASGSKPEHSLLDEKLDLNAFYGKPIHDSSVDKLALPSKEYHCRRTNGGNKQMMKMMDEIINRSSHLGKSYSVMRTGADEECERELEREIEEEEEEEIEFDRMTAFDEKDWDYTSIFRSRSPTNLPIEVHHISDIMCNYISCKSLTNIKWSKKVLCTSNFIHTIQIKDGNLDDFLRVPDCVIYFPSGETLLISDREANEILDLFQGSTGSNKKNVNSHSFGHYAFEIEPDQEPLLRCGKKNVIMHDDIICSTKLFNGETMYPRNQQRVLKDMLSCAKDCIDSSESFATTEASGEPEVLVLARRKNANFEMSDLENICKEIAMEVIMMK